ncbi:MAG: aminopeptidase P family protein [Chloroflexi bacterium]|nr:aminopeptidase P family protein [Chloroflexota bacterium]
MAIIDRLQKLREHFDGKEIDGIFISQPENRRYLSGFTGSAGYLLITPQDAILATDFRYIEQSKQQAPDFAVFRVTSDVAEWFPKLLAGVTVSQLGFEASDITFATYRQLTEALAKGKSTVKLVPTEGIVETIRAVKEPEEIDLITQAVRISDRAIEYISDRIRPGMTEIAVAWEIEKFMREQGSESVPFEIIVASGPNAALPHARPSSREIKAGEPIVIDIGARCGGYSSDLSRTLCPGTPADTFRKVYDTVLGAQLAAIAIIREGMTGEEADRLARTVIEEAGYGEAFGHSLGHGVGLATHEAPRLGPKSTTHLATGMVFTVEPGIYLPGWGGVRIEDVVLLEKDRAKVISKAKKIES